MDEEDPIEIAPELDTSKCYRNMLDGGYLGKFVREEAGPNGSINYVFQNRVVSIGSEGVKNTVIETACKGGRRRKSKKSGRRTRKTRRSRK